jgi:hypothetical protein|nr:MAG TPA: hypothetical protein [Caudoviricetes sp.]
MADPKIVTIDELQAATTLTGNELVPVSDGATTKKATVNAIVAKAAGLTPQQTQKLNDAATTTEVTTAITNATKDLASKQFVQDEIKKIPPAAATQDHFPKFIAYLEYTNGQAGAKPTGAPALVPVATLTKVDLGSVKLTWPEVKAQDNWVMILPEAGMYMCQLIPSEPSETKIYLNDFQDTMDGFKGPQQASKAVPLGTGFSFVFGTNIPNRLVRLPLTTVGETRQPLPDMTVVITQLSKK